MKEKLYTIPLNDAVNANDECAFCYIRRNIEQDLIDYTLGSGSSYMQSDTRAATDSEGFCSNCFKKMYDYGNTLGNAWILKTHYDSTINGMKKEFKKFKPSPKQSFLNKKSSSETNTIVNWLKKREESCYICNRIEDTYNRYMDTFFYLYQNDDAFKTKVISGKGFCLTHFKDICIAADSLLPQKAKEDFFTTLFKLMEENMLRISEDVSWMVDKFDYKNKDADWKNSKDSIQRGMQKLKGGYPADAPFKTNK